MEGDVVCSLQRHVLLQEEMLLDMGVAEAAHKYVPSHNIEGLHGGIVVEPCGRARCSEVTVRGQFPEWRCAGTNQLTWRLFPTLEQRAVELGRRGSKWAVKAARSSSQGTFASILEWTKAQMVLYIWSRHNVKR